jgi:Glucokinase
MIAERLRLTYGHAACGSVLTGPGLVALAQWIAQSEGLSTNVQQPSDVFARAASGEDAICAEALALFTTWLGRLAADVCLTLGALGGVSTSAAASFRARAGSSIGDYSVRLSRPAGHAQISAQPALLSHHGRTARL